MSQLVLPSQGRVKESLANCQASDISDLKLKYGKCLYLK